MKKKKEKKKNAPVLYRVDALRASRLIIGR